MKHLLFYSVILLLFTSCYAYKGTYDVGLKSVERSQETQQKYGEYTINNSKENSATKYEYEDDMIRVVWTPMRERFHFILTNKTSQSIKIIWDETVYVNHKGISNKILHTGVKYSEKEDSQPPTVVVSKSRTEQQILPVDNVYWVSGEYGGWKTKPLFSYRASSQEQLDDVTNQYIGKDVQIVLPLEIQGQVNEYIFRFRIEDFIQN